MPAAWFLSPARNLQTLLRDAQRAQAPSGAHPRRRKANNAMQPRQTNAWQLARCQAAKHDPASHQLLPRLHRGFELLKGSVHASFDGGRGCLAAPERVCGRARSKVSGEVNLTPRCCSLRKAAIVRGNCFFFLDPLFFLSPFFSCSQFSCGPTGVQLRLNFPYLRGGMRRSELAHTKKVNANQEARNRCTKTSYVLLGKGGAFEKPL